MNTQTEEEKEVKVILDDFFAELEIIKREQEVCIAEYRKKLEEYKIQLLKQRIQSMDKQ